MTSHRILLVSGADITLEMQLADVKDVLEILGMLYKDPDADHDADREG